MDRIEELEKENKELKAEITKLQVLISQLKNPFPDDVRAHFQKQQYEADQRRMRIENDCRVRAGLSARWYL